MTTLIGIDAATKPRNIGLACGRVISGALVVEKVVLGSEVESVSDSRWLDCRADYHRN